MTDRDCDLCKVSGSCPPPAPFLCPNHRTTSHIVEELRRTGRRTKSLTKAWASFQDAALIEILETRLTVAEADADLLSLVLGTDCLCDEYANGGSDPIPKCYAHEAHAAAVDHRQPPPKWYVAEPEPFTRQGPS